MKKPAKKPTRGRVANKRLAVIREAGRQLLNASMRCAVYFENPCCRDHAEAEIYGVFEAAHAFGKLIADGGYNRVRDVKGLVSVEVASIHVVGEFRPPKGEN